MSKMDIPSNTQQLVLRYLLDELSPEERERTDAALITDQGFSDSFQEAKDAWVDVYVDGALSPALKSRVEEAILSLPDGPATLQLAAALRKPQESQRQQPPVLSMRRGNARMKWMVAALAACLVVVLFLGRSGLWHAASRQSASSPAVSPPPDSVKPLRPSPEAPVVATAPEGGGPARRATVVLLMPFGTTRGVDDLPLPLAAGAERVQVQWPLPAEAAAGRCILIIRRDGTPEKRILQRGAVIHAGETRIANFLLRADSLVDGEYSFALYGSDESAPVAQQTVLVSRQP